MPSHMSRRSNVGRFGHFLTMRMASSGQASDAQPAEDAAGVVDLEAHRVLRMRRVVRVEARFDLDDLGRAHRRAHVAGDALRRAVRPLGQHVLAAVVRRVVGPGLLRVVGGERALARPSSSATCSS